MKPYKELQLKEYKTVKKHSKKSCVEYINIPCAFDIETTSTYTNSNEKIAFMYIWQFGIDDEIVYGRTWGEFIELCETLQTRYNLSESKRLICYVHNLSFEFQFMRKLFTWDNFFAVKDRTPIKALCEYGIEFRDSYILSGYNLATTAKNLTSHKIEKLYGDLDYSLVRHDETVLTDQELKYCEYDIQILLFYIQEQIEQFGDIAKIVATNTGRVRQYVKNQCFYTDKNHAKSKSKKFNAYRKLMSNLTLTGEQYKQQVLAFQGGFTHANANYTEQILKDVASIDFTSSYPAVMLSEKFPMSRPMKCKFKTKQEFEHFVYSPDYCMIFEVCFENIEPTFFEDNYISESKCDVLENHISNNGRVFSADRLSTTITDLDYRIIKATYKWTKMYICNVQLFNAQYLPKPIIESIQHFYEGKTTLKGVKGSEVEYLNSKGMLNSVYGMSVTAIVKDDITYDDKWGIEKVDTDSKIDEYNTKKDRFLYYTWGVFVTAYARFNLWQGILNVGKDYIYSDTDSIKMLNYENHLDYIQSYNEKITAKIKDMCKYHKLDYSLFEPKTIKGVKKPIGVWDFEGVYKQFKTLGAKRYMYQEQDNTYHITIAGLPKQCVNYLVELGNGDPFNIFDFDLYIPCDNSHKMNHTYIDDVMETNITDYTGKTKHIIALSGLHLEKTDFTLYEGKEYAKFLYNLRNGYILKGEKENV